MPPASARGGLLAECELTTGHFTCFTTMQYEHAGIRMRDGNEGLVRAPLTKRLRALGIADFDAYLCACSPGRAGPSLAT